MKSVNLLTVQKIKRWLDFWGHSVYCVVVLRQGRERNVNNVRNP